MSDELRTAEMHDLLSRNDRDARDELLRRVSDNIDRLARKMLHTFPSVRRWEGTGDVAQNAKLRLLRALNHVTPADTKQFFALASEQIRRELLDLARHYYGPHGHGANHATRDGNESEPANTAAEATGMTDWCEFHEQIANLSADDREMFDLLYYQGLSQEDAARLLEVNIRTVQRRWQQARINLHALIKQPT